MFAIEDVDATVTIDPIEPPVAFRRVAVGEEFTEADTMMPRPFSTVDIGHFLSVMQVCLAYTKKHGNNRSIIDQS